LSKKDFFLKNLNNINSQAESLVSLRNIQFAFLSNSINKFLC